MSRTVFADVQAFEIRLGLPTGFYDQFLREDDWSFVIKLNALFEGACTQVLAARLHAPKLADAFAHLDLANSKYGKVVLLRALGAITSDQAGILRMLAELRNDLVHNIANVRFSFADHVASRDTNQLDTLIKRFGHGIQDVVELDGKPMQRAQFVRENPKLSLWLTAAEIVACLHLEFEVAHLRLQSTALTEYARLAMLPGASHIGSETK